MDGRSPCQEELQENLTVGTVPVKMDTMERLIPNQHDLSPLVNQIVTALDRFGDAVKTINTALYVQGFLTGITICATILTAIWAFSQKR